MPRIPDEEIARIKRETDLVALVRSRGVELGKHGTKDWSGRCPFHPEDQASGGARSLPSGGAPPRRPRAETDLTGSPRIGDHRGVRGLSSPVTRRSVTVLARGEAGEWKVFLGLEQRAKISAIMKDALALKAAGDKARAVEKLRSALEIDRNNALVRYLLEHWEAEKAP